MVGRTRIAAAGALVLGAGAFWWYTAHAQEPRIKLAPFVRAQFLTIDQNRDRYMARDELARAQRLAEAIAMIDFDSADADHDGRVSIEEFQDYVTFVNESLTQSQQQDTSGSVVESALSIEDLLRQKAKTDAQKAELQKLLAQLASLKDDDAKVTYILEHADAYPSARSTIVGWAGRYVRRASVARRVIGHTRRHPVVRPGATTPARTPRPVVRPPARGKRPRRRR